MIQTTSIFARPHVPASRHGFTLVEILVVIAIIGILSAISVPAIFGAVRRAKQGAQKLEVDSLSRAVEAYFQKYGDYPPDGSSEAVVIRHMRRIFPRMAEPDLTLMTKLVDGSNSNTAGTFSAAAMDRAEALVFFLGGFSKNVQNPLTGEGGPLTLAPGFTDKTSTNIAEYQVNVARDNSFFDFDQARLTVNRAAAADPLLSNDEFTFGYNDAAHGGLDLLPVYLANSDQPAPIVYFDSRTYGVIGLDTSSMPNRNVYNGYRSTSTGGVRPYKTEIGADPPASSNYGSEAAAFAAIKFHNRDTFQIIHPGSDGIFGSIVSTSAADPAAVPTIHFVTESGRPVQPLDTATNSEGLVYTNANLGSRGYQDRDWGSFGVNGNLDNVTNFSSSILEADLQ